MGKTVSVYSRINPMRVSKRFRDLYKTKKGSASTTGGNISWLKKKNEMSEFLIKPNR